MELKSSINVTDLKDQGKFFEGFFRIDVINVKGKRGDKQVMLLEKSELEELYKKIGEVLNAD